MSQPIEVEWTDGVCLIHLKNGKVNAFDFALIEAIEQTLTEAAAKKSIVIITGQSGIFSAGYDLKIMTSGPENVRALVTAGSKLYERILTFPYPVIIACSGHAVANGALMLCAADYRIGAQGAFRIGLNEVELGITMHRAGIVVTQYRLTPSAFQSALNLGMMFNPDSAVNAGFLDEVVLEDKLLETAMARAKTMRKMSMLAHAQTKLKIREHWLKDLQKAIEQDLEKMI